MDEKIQKERFAFIMTLLDLEKLQERQEFQGIDKKTISRWTQKKFIPTRNSKYFKSFNDAGVIGFLATDFHSSDDFITALASLINSSFLKELINNRYNPQNIKRYFSDENNPYKEINKKNNFTAIKKIDDKLLPYYQDRDKPEFIKLHLDIIKRRFPALEKKLNDKILTVTISNGETWTFPAINLLDHNQTLNISNLDISSKIEPPNNYTANFIPTLKEARPRAQDNRTFAVKSLTPTTGELSCKISSYFKALYYCDMHFFNIISHYTGLSDAQRQTYESHFFLREWAEHLNNMLIKNDFSQIELSIGISCLVIHKTPNGYKSFLCHKSQAANGSHDMHVIPSAMYQPLGNFLPDFNKELEPYMHVLRELAEEIFGHPDFNAGIHPEFLHQQIKEKKQIADILTLESQGKATFTITGFYMDLYRLRPEILTTLIIDDESWFNTHFDSNTILGCWEVIDHGVIAPDISNAIFELIITQQSGHLCSPGMACYVKGIEHFRKTHPHEPF